MRNKIQNHHFYELDVIRFIAALSVVLFHLAFRGWNMEDIGYDPYPELSYFFKYGYLGVDIFFMVSGFVILLTASRRGPISFIISRISRLYPAYWICATTTFFFAIFFPIANYDLVFTDYLVNLTMLQGFLGFHHIDGSYWTLMIELQFYAMILIILTLRLIHHIHILLGLWLISLLCIDLYNCSEVLKSILIYKWGHYFISGAVFYLIWKNGIKTYLLALLLVCYIRALRLGYWYMNLKQNLLLVL